MSGGRTFASGGHVSQGGRRCATAILLLDVIAPDVIRHAVAPPGVPGPYESEPCDMSVMGRDIRVVDGAYTDDPDAPVGPPVIDAWVRFREVPEDPLSACRPAGTVHRPHVHRRRPAPARTASGSARHTARISTAINAIGFPFTPTSTPTGGCSTTTYRRSPATA